MPMFSESMELELLGRGYVGHGLQPLAEADSPFQEVSSSWQGVEEWTSTLFRVYDFRV